MNTSILKKAIESLSAEMPNIPYVLGMLETLVEMTEQTKPPAAHTAWLDDIGNIPGNRAIVTPVADEASLLDAKARVAIDTAKRLSEIGQDA